MSRWKRLLDMLHLCVKLFLVIVGSLRQVSVEVSSVERRVLMFDTPSVVIVFIVVVVLSRFFKSQMFHL